jgi:hypothetical protein
MKTHLLWMLLLIPVFCGIAQQKSKEELDREKRFQEEAAKANKDTSTFLGWKHAAATGLNLSEVSFKDWSGGGENSLAYSLWLQGSSALVEEKTLWTNSYRLAFGQSRLSDQGLRKTDDEIYAETFLIYKVGAIINPYAAATLRTQFAPGYSYDGGSATEISKFFDPGYVTQSAGVAYAPLPGVTTRFGLAMRDIFTSAHRRYANDVNSTSDKKVSVTGGLESVSELSLGIAENVSLVMRLELYDPFESMDKVIVRNDDAIVAKINNYLTTVLTLNLLNDVHVTPRTQIKQALAVEVNYTLL